MPNDPSQKEASGLTTERQVKKDVGGKMPNDPSQMSVLRMKGILYY